MPVWLNSGELVVLMYAFKVSKYSEGMYASHWVNKPAWSPFHEPGWYTARPYVCTSLSEILRAVATSLGKVLKS